MNLHLSRFSSVLSRRVWHARASLRPRTTRPIVEPLEERNLLSSGRTFYVDPLRGNDSNPGTSVDNPWKTYLNVISYYSWSGTRQPSTWVGLQPGDTVVFRDGVYKDSIRYSQRDEGFDLFGVQGTADAPITFKAYPGERPTFSARLPGAGGEMAGVHLDLAKYIVLDGLEVTGTYGDGMWVQRSDHITIQNCWVHDNDGNHANNIAGIAVQGQGHTLIQNNLINDNYDHAQLSSVSPGNSNSRNVLIYPDETTVPAGPGPEVEIAHNTVFNTNPVTSDHSGAGIWVKHARLSPDWNAWIHDNIVQNAQYVSIGGMSAGLRIEHNLILNSDPIDYGESVGYNTIVGGGLLYYTSGVESDWTSVNIHDNVVVDPRTTTSDYTGVVRIKPYGTSSEYAQIVAAGKLALVSNVYWNPNANLRWVLFSTTVGQNGEPLGGIYDFSTWRQRGYDTSSLVADPALDSGYSPTNRAAQPEGWLGGSGLHLGVVLNKEVVSEKDGAHAAVLTLSRGSVGLGQSLTVSLTSSDPTELTVPATVSFPAGVATITVDVAAVDDGVVEPTRAVQLSARAPDGTMASNWLRVKQVSGPSPGSLQFMTSSLTVDESAGVATIEVDRVGGSEGTVSVSYQTIAGTAIAGTDFRATSRILTFSPGQTVGSIAVPIIDDHLHEANENFYVTLGNPTGGAGLGAGGMTIVIIVDNDPAPMPLQVVAMQPVRDRRGLTAIDVRFNDALNPTQARKLNNYQVRRAGRDRRFGTRDDVRLRLKAATYNASAHTVRLVLANRFTKRDSLQILVSGIGLWSASGVRLDGNSDGVPGDNYLQVLRT